MQFKQLALVAPLFLAFALASPIGDIESFHGVEARDKDSDEIWLWKEKREELEQDSDAIWLWKKEREQKRDQLEKDSDDIWLW
ncbi:hypothetical protein F4775DRAFT_596466 [Biscogniauxia sp. FL1348]|nr:hypothetical protein F4775DRAFT_596466 [Biscogniauxia sp. FL1348]